MLLVFTNQEEYMEEAFDLISHKVIKCLGHILFPAEVNERNECWVHVVIDYFLQNIIARKGLVATSVLSVLCFIVLGIYLGSLILT